METPIKTEIETYLHDADTNVFQMERALKIRPQGLRDKLRRGTLPYGEAHKIAHAIGKRIVWVDK